MGDLRGTGGRRTLSPGQSSHPTDGTISEPRPSDQAVDGHGSVPPGVDGCTTALLEELGRRGVREEPGLVVAEDEEPRVEPDAVARAGGHPLDRQDLAIGLTEDDDRAAARPAADRRIDEEPVARQDPRRHRALADRDPPRTAEAV